MSQLDAVLRYDHLRVAIREVHPDPETLNSLQEEFSELLEATPHCNTVIIDLPTAEGLDTQVVGLLNSWQRIVSLGGRRCRLNGVSPILSQVNSVAASACLPPHASARRNHLAVV